MLGVVRQYTALDRQWTAIARVVGWDTMAAGWGCARQSAAHTPWNRGISPPGIFVGCDGTATTGSAVRQSGGSGL